MRNQRMATAFAAVGALVGLMAVVLPASPASASCSTVQYAHYEDSGAKGWKLIGDGSCSERWGQVVVDSTYPTAPGYSVKIERQIKSPYGYATEATYTATLPGSATGSRSTTHTTNSSGDLDRHRLCWDYASYNGSAWVPDGSWTCSGWYY
ncbi:hypothetical protein ABT023_01845 [Micromonospora sp. NPDC002296]|uniref:hypothetical protein n=1 Tax=Micromonospora sp. NPDC002296 TaxID=3154271 RepID=UPI0033343260